jgi:tRNA(Ile)-lysidine synthase
VDIKRPLLLAVSGGPDSTALLLGCCALREKIGLKAVVAHFDHRLRPGSAGDGEFVQRLCDSLGVRFIAGSGDVARRARRRRESVEAAAREMRYAFLARAARDSGAQGVATGHTLDDQAETVLLHILRGAGLGGLAGMRPRSRRRATGGGPALTVFRPLLEVRHADAAAFCAARDIQPREDPTNRDLRFARNRVRLKVVPELERLNPRVAEALGGLAEAAAEGIAVIEGRMPRIEEGVPAAESVTLSRRQLRSAPKAVAHRMLIGAFEAASGSRAGLEKRHLSSMLAAAAAGAGRSVDLPAGVRFESGHTDVRLTRGRGQMDQAQRRFTAPESTFPVPGRLRLAGGPTIKADVVARPRSVDDGAPNVAYVDPSLADEVLKVRGRRRGDRFHALGMAAPGKLQDFFVGQHVPREHRDRVPLVVSPRGIVWVAGYRIAEWAKLNPGAERALRIELLGGGSI